MIATTLLTPLKPAGYALELPPRTGTWRIDPDLSYLELHVREFHRTSVLEADIVDGEAHLSETASTSGIRLQLGAAFTRRGSSRAAEWMHAAGLGSIEKSPRFTSRILLAAPYGWRMCGYLRTEHLDAMLIADALVHSVRTRADGRDAMVMTAGGAITRTRTRELSEVLLRSRVAVRIHTYLIHD